MNKVVTFEITGCIDCPCLRNTKYGSFTCFYNDNYGIDEYEIKDIPDWCPLLENVKE